MTRSAVALLSRPIHGRRQDAPHFDSRNIPLVVVATLVLASVSSIFVLHPFTPEFPQPGLDPSWIAVTGEAAARRARWGLDIIFTYGPAAPLATNYFNDDFFSRTLPALLGFSVIHALCASSLLTLRSARNPRGFLRSLAGVAAYTLVLVATSQNPDAFYFCTVFLAFLLDLQRRPGDRLASAAIVLGVAATGLFCLSKLSYGLSALPLFALGDIRAWRRGRVPFRLGLMVAAFLATDLAYGQSLADLPAFLSMQKEIIAGYTDAMSAAGYLLETQAFVAASGLVLVLVTAVELSAPRPWSERLMLPVGLAILLLLIFKAGFVRHDLHSLIAWTALGLAGTMVAFGRIMPRSVWAGTALAALSLGAALVVNPYVTAVANGDPDAGAAMVQVYHDWLLVGPPEEVAATIRAVAKPADFAASLKQRKEAAWAEIRKAYPLQKFDGTVDIIQSDQTNLIANGLDYHPRPVFQEYSTYTAELMRVNRAFYEGRTAPDWVIFAPGSIDERFPAFAEGHLWPDLIRLYEPVRRLGDSVALHRRSTPAPEILGPATTRVASFNEFVPLDGSAPLYARIVVKPTLLGRLLALAYRSPLMTMVVRLGNGEERSYRFIPALGAGGFVLSPAIYTADDFARLALGGPKSGPGETVTDVKIVGGGLVRLAFGRDVTFELTPIMASKIDHSPDAEPLYAALLGAAPWHDIVRRAGLESQLDGEGRLAFHPPTRLVVPVEGARHFGFAFGIEPGAWKPGRTDGVCFDVKPASGGDPIWHRCLDPLRVEADRSEQSALVDLPASVDEVAVESSCKESCDGDRSYLKNAGPVR